MIDWLPVILIAALLFYGIVIYNRLVRDRQRTYAGWSDIEVQLKRRHELIPKLVAAVRQYAQLKRKVEPLVLHIDFAHPQIIRLDAGYRDAHGEPAAVPKRRFIPFFAQLIGRIEEILTRQDGIIRQITG